MLCHFRTDTVCIVSDIPFKNRGDIIKRIITILICTVLVFLPSCFSEKTEINTTEPLSFLSETNENTSHSELPSLTEESSSEELTENTDNSTVFSDEKETAPSSEASTELKAENVCTISICCIKAAENKSMLKSGKELFLPSNGYILGNTEVEFQSGETVFDVFKRVCAGNICTDKCEYCLNGGIQFESSYNPGFDNYYIEGIHQIYEKDCGPMSGWMYKVNGVFPNYGCSSYYLQNGDRIEFVYTCDLGADLGAQF